MKAMETREQVMKILMMI